MTTYKNDRLKIFALKNRLKYLNEKQRKCDYDKWIKYQNAIEDIEFKISYIFQWKKFERQQFAKTAKEL